MSTDRANPFPDLNEFQAKPKPKPVQKEEIEKLARENGFPSRQPIKPTPENKVKPAAKSERKGRRYTTGRNQQINIKATAETIDRLYRLADDQNIPLGKLLDMALDAFEQTSGRDSS